MANVRDPFSADALKDPKVLENFKRNRDILAHFNHPEYGEAFDETLKTIHQLAKKLPADQAHNDWSDLSTKMATEALVQPTIMQALMTIYGKAPKPGDPDARREPLQEEHLTAVEELPGELSVEDLKNKGNDYFKDGNNAMALALYQRAMTTLRRKRDFDTLALVTLLSNSSLCLIKLGFPDRAKTSCTHGLRLVEKHGDQKFDQSKLFYRRALACEKLDELANAEDDMKRAMKEGERMELSAAQQQNLRKEYGRVHKAHTIQIEEHKKRDMDRGYWGAFVKKDVVAEYEDANKWSHNTSKIENRFDADGVESRFDKWGDRVQPPQADAKAADNDAPADTDAKN